MSSKRTDVASSVPATAATSPDDARHGALGRYDNAGLVVPDDFDAPLPGETLVLFEGDASIATDIQAAWIGEARQRVADVDSGRVATLSNEEALRLINADD